MKRRDHNPENMAAPVGRYSHAVEIEPGNRYLFISGQIPEKPDGSVPEGFEAQCHAVWDNIFAVLASADMDAQHLVKVTTFLTSAKQTEANSRIRQARLGELHPALTVVVAGTLESQWLLEIEAIAAAPPSDFVPRGERRVD